MKKNKDTYKEFTETLKENFIEMGFKKEDAIRMKENYRGTFNMNASLKENVDKALKRFLGNATNFYWVYDEYYDPETCKFDQWLKRTGYKRALLPEEQLA